jgi:hypothetical protein
MFVTALVATMARYPEPVVLMAAHPLKGILRRYKFVPSIAEVADELEALRTRIKLASMGARKALQPARPGAVAMTPISQIQRLVLPDVAPAFLGERVKRMKSHDPVSLGKRHFASLDLLPVRELGIVGRHGKRHRIHDHLQVGLAFFVRHCAVAHGPILSGRRGQGQTLTFPGTGGAP